MGHCCISSKTKIEKVKNMSYTINLSGEDLQYFNKALDLKNKGEEQHQNQNKEIAKELTQEALKEIKKVKDTTNMEVVVLKSNICQNLTLFDM